MAQRHETALPYFITLVQEGVAQLRGRTLRYIEGDKDSMSLGAGVDVNFAKGKITFKYLKEPDLARTAFCGSHARLDWTGRSSF